MICVLGFQIDWAESPKSALEWNPNFLSEENSPFEAHHVVQQHLSCRLEWLHPLSEYLVQVLAVTLPIQHPAYMRGQHLMADVLGYLPPMQKNCIEFQA